MPAVFYFFQYHHVYRLRGHRRIRKDNSGKTARSISREEIPRKRSPSRARAMIDADRGRYPTPRSARVLGHGGDAPSDECVSLRISARPDTPYDREADTERWGYRHLRPFFSLVTCNSGICAMTRDRDSCLDQCDGDP